MMHNISTCESKAWKSIQAWIQFKPMTKTVVKSCEYACQTGSICWKVICICRVPYLCPNYNIYVQIAIYIWHSIWIYIYWHFGHIYYHLDTNITIWIYILQFGQIYCNLDINMETRHMYKTFQHIDPVSQAYARLVFLKRWLYSEHIAIQKYSKIK